MSATHPVRNGRSQPSDSCESGVNRDPVEQLATEFATRFRDGERVTVEDYAKRYPEWAEQIRDLFPTIIQMEQLNAKRLNESGVASGSAPKQLGDYRIVGEIARGGMGIVYEAEQVSLGRRVAVKVLPPQSLRRERDVRRFEREAQTAANLHHSNIVPVFGVGEENGQRYIVMQLIHGVGLDETLREVKAVVTDNAHHESGVSTSRVSTAKRSAAELLESDLELHSTRVEAEDQTVEMPARSSTRPNVPPIAVHTRIGSEYFRNVARIGRQAADALNYAHQNNTLHRDIKPANLLLDEDGRVWIADFGLAKALQDDDVTCSGDLVGTMAYVAPERFQGKTTKASDIYSLGVTLHEMLTLQKAYEGQDRVAVMNQVTRERLPRPRKLNPSVPRDLETIVLKAASHDPQDRYPTAARLAADLEAFLEGRPIEARRLSYVEHGLRWCGRNRSMAGLAAAVVVLLAAVLGLLAFGYRHSDRQRQNAEVIAQAAVDALEEIFNRFALTPLDTSLGGDDPDEAEIESVAVPQMPISKDVALLLENLLEFYDELSTQTEDSEVVTVKVIAANRRVGDIHRRLGQLEDARLSYETAVNRIQQLSSALRDTPTMRLEKARAHNGLGLSFLHGWTHSRDRVNAHRNAVAILDIADSTEEEQFELATSLYLLHRAQQRRNRSRSKREQPSADASRPLLLDRAREILARLKANRPQRADYDLLLARCLLAESYSFRDEEETLHENQRQAIAILDKLIERFPENPDYRFELGQVYQSIEWRRSHRRGKGCDPKRLAESELRLRKALQVTAHLEVRHPNIPQYLWLKKHLHEMTGRVLRKQAKYAEAEAQYERAIEIQRLLISRDENSERYQRWLYELQVEYARLLRDAGALGRAKDVLETSIGHLEALIERSASEHRNRYEQRRYDDNRHWLQRAYCTLACVLDKLGEHDASREMLLKASDLGEL